jgi:WD40 repeat protein
MKAHVCFSPDGRFLATSGGSGAGLAQQVRVWNLASGKETGAWAGHRSHVHCVSFSPDGRYLATGGGDATALIWDCRAAGVE